MTKNGIGTLELTGLNTNSGAVTINAGTLKLDGTGQNHRGLTINRGATVLADNTASNQANRFNAFQNSSTINLTVATLSLVANSGVNATETTGALTIANTAGVSVVALTPTAGSSAKYTVTGAFARTAGGGTQVIFRGNNMGSTLGNNVANVVFTTAPTLTNNVILGAFVDASSAGGQLAFAGYDATNGVKAISTTAYASALTTDNAVQTLSGGTTAIIGKGVNTLTVDNTSGITQTLNVGTTNLTVPQVLFTGTSAVTVGGTNKFDLSATEGVIASSNTAGVTFSTQVLGAGSSNRALSVVGSGTVTFSGGVSASQSNFNVNGPGMTVLDSGETGQPITVNGGTLKLTSNASMAIGKGLTVNSTGTLLLTSNAPTKFINSGTTINTGSKVSMVDGTVGTFTFGGTAAISGADLKLGAAPLFTFELDAAGGADKLVFTGAATVTAAGAIIDVTGLGGSLQLGDYTLITAASGNGLGTSAWSLASSQITVGSNTYSLSLANSTGTAEILTVIPEPATMTLMSLGLVGLLARRRRMA